MNDLLHAIQPYALTGVFVLTYLAEHLMPQRKEIIDHNHDIKNVLVGVFNLVLIAVVGVQFQKAIEWLNNRHFGLLQLFHIPSVIDIIMGVLLIDIFMYWWHRVNHEWRFLWYFHKFHHVDTKLNSTSALRFHAGELLLSYVTKIVVFSLLGISLSAVLVHSLLFFPIIVFHHSNLKISERWDLFLRRFIVTPRMHRIHHSVIKTETNSNYSSVLPYWDILFRSYVKRPSREIEFGV
ncbi:MAG TPA: sterol desaturase family protein [Flavisolibacter sp.]|jgi:sterol desaturase/sphingolipid hydroxylase (fatty acid hydroxylase superfamily)|nr:sterol desaturase family protein [Flavisolibacter sp.]